DNYENLVGYNSSNIIGNDFYLRDLDENYSMKGLSIVDSMNLSLLFDVESSKFNRNLKANDEIEITFGKNNYSAHIKDIKQNDGIITIVCDMNDGINDLINKRFIPITVIDKKTKVFKIPKKSILTKDSIEGVYIKKETGIIKFVAVKVLKADDKFAYVSTGTDGEIDVNNRKVKTLELYDYIVKNPRFVKEGELLK
ncbi:MAG: HlyD family efflux transporter periplasmic adaptor subunit, partial [Finegoldia magna]|nr:HlyD family efflux transporter periplasmic adaptor subunit [Finegoldia magna]